MPDRMPPLGASPDAAVEIRWQAALKALPRLAPYLAGLADRFPDVHAGPAWALTAQEGALARVRALALEPPAFEDGMAVLRRAKAQTHLAVALRDLCGETCLQATTGAISTFADAAVEAALALSVRALAERGQLPFPQAGAAHGPVPGFLVLAMGKGGALELNYSSDIDISLFFDAEVLPARAGHEARPLAQRITQHLVRALEAITPDGYVFRTDLRLRPDPNSTSPAVTVSAAQHYYQSLGQNWERAAFIKARVCAGDIPAGEAFLKGLDSFIWRRHLDYAAIEDIQAIKRRIRAAKGEGGLSDPAFDVKLGWGGIRDIELFAQTQQLILGGRRPELRTRQTLDALARLAAAGILAPADAAVLSAAYAFFRHVEHRLQMVADAQTHAIPADPEAAARIAALCGLRSLDALDSAISAHRTAVTQVDRRLFADRPEVDDPLLDLNFTGVENDPATNAVLRELGFQDPEAAGAIIREWRSGRLRALRSERARRLMAGLTPRILRAAAEGDAPDLAFARMAHLIAGLSAGVQLLSLFEARPVLIAETMAALALSAPLAEILARRPALLDGLAESRFFSPIRHDPPGSLAQVVADATRAAPGFDDAMNAARRVHREESLRIAMQVLKGIATAQEAGRAYAELADTTVRLMADAAVHEVESSRGPLPGPFCVVALGKLGGRELSAGSDLDVMLVYEDQEEPSTVDAVQAFAKLTQRLITALSAPTEEGILYEVDMQLRPSGSKGPVAVRLSSFVRYYREEAWTWELLALTRARPVAGDPAFCARLMAETRAILNAPRDRAKTLADAAAMRARMERDRPAAGPWDLKLRPGGIVDLEFIVQALQLAAGPAALGLPQSNTGEAIAALARNGVFSAAEAAALREAFHAYANVQQVLRICAPGGLDGAQSSKRLQDLLARALGVVRFEEVEARLASHARAVRTLFLQHIGDGTPDGPALKPL